MLREGALVRATGERLRVALVHDWLNQLGGAENVLEEMAGLFPGAPIYTSIYAPERMPDAYRSWSIHTTFMQRLPGIAAHHQPYMPIYPLAFRRMDLSGYDLVLSNKSGFCHGVYTGNGVNKRAVHVCYCLTPTRFLWLFEQYREREQLARAFGAALRPMLALLRKWDRAAAQRVDHFIAISTTVQQRIRDIYGRESVVIHPPVDTAYFTPDPMVAAGDYYLSVGRLIPYKRVDLAVEAFRHLPQEKLIVVGAGRDREALEAQAGSNVEFLGRQDGGSVRELMRGCKAFLFPGLEDFGITPVEAMSAGRPVIAYGAGGALDTVAPGVSGELFPEQTAECLAETIARFDAWAYNPAACRAQAEKFSAENFRSKLVNYLEQVLLERDNRAGTQRRREGTRPHDMLRTWEAILSRLLTHLDCAKLETSYRPAITCNESPKWTDRRRQRVRKLELPQAH